MSRPDAGHEGISFFFTLARASLECADKPAHSKDALYSPAKSFLTLRPLVGISGGPDRPPSQ